MKLELHTKSHISDPNEWLRIRVWRNSDCIMLKSLFSLDSSFFTEGASKVKLHELVGSLKDTAKLGNIKRQLNIVDKRKKVVSTPLPKHEKQKVWFYNTWFLMIKFLSLLMMRKHVLAYWLRKSEVFTWDRNSYLTHAISPMGEIKKKKLFTSIRFALVV